MLTRVLSGAARAARATAVRAQWASVARPALPRHWAGPAVPALSSLASTIADLPPPSSSPSGEDESEESEESSDSSSDEEGEEGEEAGGTTLHGGAMKPSQVVSALDSFIVGQGDAKRAVAIALRNRYRRQQLPEELRAEVVPKNILMIGPTGCGKTEIARRIAKLADAPFLKVEATKFTEVGFHGRDVDQIIRDLVDTSIALTKRLKRERLQKQLRRLVEDRILDTLTGEAAREDTRESFRRLLRAGELDEREIDVDVPTQPAGGAAIAIDPSQGGPILMNELLGRLQQAAGGKTERRRMTIGESRKVLEEVELEKLMDEGDVTREAIRAVEESGIVFIDEIDKICSPAEHRSTDASAEGVQRDLLPLIEGSAITTKHGTVNTDFILFIASGAFTAVKPADMLAELQGRLPIRVELNGLTEDDLYRILTEPITNLIRQQKELLATEGVQLTFEEDAIREIARVAAELNLTVENIGARRLHTVIERIVEEVSFDAPDMDEGAEVQVTKDLVNERLSEMLVKTDLSKFIL